jgi:hypothetical protein
MPIVLFVQAIFQWLDCWDAIAASGSPEEQTALSFVDALVGDDARFLERISPLLLIMLVLPEEQDARDGDWPEGLSNEEAEQIAAFEAACEAEEGGVDQYDDDDLPGAGDVADALSPDHEAGTDWDVGFPTSKTHQLPF